VIDLKVALVCTEKLPVPPVAGGAIQMYIDGVLPYLSPHHDITVFCVQHPSLPPEEIRENVHYIRVPGKSQSIYIRNIVESIAASAGMDEAPYDLIHVFNRPKFLLTLSERFPGCKFSLSLHNEMMHAEKISDEAGLRCIEKSEFINTVSRYIADTVTSRFPSAEGKVRVVYSGVDPVRFNPPWTHEGAAKKYEMRSKYGLLDYRVILYVGRLSIKKGVHILVDAMEKVMQTHPDTALVIAGSKWYGSNAGDEYTEMLRKQVLKLPGPVVFTGFIPPSDIADYYCLGDIFVCASQWNEPLARVHYEAMAAGIPIITTNRGGNAEVITGAAESNAAGTAVNCGFVIDRYNDPETMADRIRFLLDNPEVAAAMGRKGRQLAEEKYNWRRVAGEIFDNVRIESPHKVVSGQSQSSKSQPPQPPVSVQQQTAEPGSLHCPGPTEPQKAGPDAYPAVPADPGADMPPAWDIPCRGTDNCRRTDNLPAEDVPGSSGLTVSDNPVDHGTSGITLPDMIVTGNTVDQETSGVTGPGVPGTAACGSTAIPGAPETEAPDTSSITIIGTGYVGLVTGACIASTGRNVVCFDQDREKIKKLSSGIIPIFEPSLEELIENGIRERRLSFTGDLKKAVAHSDIIFITVGTPSLPDGSCDTSNVFEAARSIGTCMDRYKIIITKSTVPPGTGRTIKQVVSAMLAARGLKIGFDVVSNPEFLREGSAVYDFMRPDRIVIGAESDKAVDAMKEIYSMQLAENIPFLVTNIETAEMIKYASNSFLAAKISFVNELANLCEKCGIDIGSVTQGMGLDSRIGPHFLDPGPGFGGSCFPKDVRALLALSIKYGCRSCMLQTILDINDAQKLRMAAKIERALGRLDGCRIAVLGLSFKPDTDDIRESPAVSVISALLERKAEISVYDPKAMENMKREHPEMELGYCSDIYSACSGSDCIVLATEWKEFSDLDFGRLRSIVRRPVFMDLRNVYSPEYVKSFGFHYEGVGRK